VTDFDLAWRIEEVCFNAFPSLKQVILDGWLLRFSTGVSRRGNSANPMRADCEPIDRIIETIERIYERQQQQAIVRVPSFMAATLDAPLSARGYTTEGDTCVLYGAMDGLATTDSEVTLLSRSTSDWLAAMGAFQQQTADQRSTYRRIVRAIAIPVAFAELRIDGRIAALAYGAVHRGLLVYESVITDPRRRRQGLSRRVIGGLAAWGRNQGATAACLQVEASNAPAHALYDGFGLKTELYRYHYRRAPDRTSET
jgi:ribosomal protein S18 acetylase RimI-like enzyme